jgi:hypothetical protein
MKYLRPALILAAWFVAMLAFLTYVVPYLWHAAHARDLTGQYANSPDHDWISSRKNKQGIPCCDIADGIRLTDVDWKSDGNTYSVRIDGAWVRIDPDRVLTEPNKIGQAMVWIWHGTVMCFIPGAGG